MSDTPETDAFIVQNTTNEGPTGVKWRSHAERLERERDKARADLEFRRGLDGARTAFVVEAMRERDEARGEAVRYRSLYYTQLGIDRSASWFPWEAKS